MSSSIKQDRCEKNVNAVDIKMKLNTKSVVIPL